MSDRTGIFAGDDPFAIAQDWLEAATESEINDPNAIALSTVDASGMPNARMVLLKEIEGLALPSGGAFVFYTNYGSVKAREIEGAGKAAFVMHWKSLRRQIRVRGLVEREEGAQADAYYASRSLKSRLGAWASRQSEPLSSRASLMADVARITARMGSNPKRPEFWGGFRIKPLEIEFWADGAFRLHDRFRWSRSTLAEPWEVTRLNP
ncbi:pyridoxamine 5'-phosphate oxidase [Thioclava sp. BHET1]|uniref:Pyridoxine/pyridoxamine 5'-phosphate oxidase n=1 Tax=Thioclava dalianensis TaxID=1185766 RepID=A0A074TJX3_9RHOB|nr:pyridoxamine 5'-phosphate oxidase [Thioclava dalianensis]KEP69258.1 pyridoxamine 5'-phosphate oxidase [Thioclava dalianensis]TMV90358.1 pyridoxamine 5'-phosphate oxidase [Thioclava sp. BHET1]SFM73223.1 Pyridoxamine 5'-phosphate oxidase [Thioclava dalianensis]